MQLKRTLALALATAAVALLVACGDDSADSDTPPASGERDAGAAPEAIVSLSPTATEMLFAIGAGDQVVAVDDQSDFPEGVPVTDLSGYEPNVEAVASYEPDMVVASELPADVTDGLEALDIEVVDVPAATALEETYDQLAELGEATGHADEAADLVETMRSDIDELAASVPEREAPPTYFHELDDTLYTATSDTFIGEIYALAGLDNVADAADPDGEFGGYPQVSSEFLVAADPDFVFLGDGECCGQDVSTFASRPGFAELTAVTEGRVVLLDDDVSSRWGPRVVEFLESIIDATATAPS